MRASTAYERPEHRTTLESALGDTGDGLHDPPNAWGARRPAIGRASSHPGRRSLLLVLVCLSLPVQAWARDMQRLSEAVYVGNAREPIWIGFGEQTARADPVGSESSPVGAVDVIEATAHDLSLQVALAGMRASPVPMEDGRTYSSVKVCGAGEFKVGRPDVPIFGQWILIPNGTQPTITVEPGTPVIFDDVDIPPVQPPCESGAGDEPPFTRDASLYATDADYPGVFAEAEPARSVRGQDCTVLWIYPFQYNPVQRRLRVYANLAAHLEFQGDIRPIPAHLRSDGSQAMLRRLAVNGDVVLAAEDGAAGQQPFERDDSVRISAAEGCDYLILCDPDFVTAADALAAWKHMKGLRTKVVTTAVAGTDPIAIRDYIRTSQSWDPAPQYLLLLGDSEFIPCFYEVPQAADATRTSGMIQGKVASDRYYGDTNDDGVADLFMGRLPVDTLSEARMVIDRIITYERDPLAVGAPETFYRNLALCACFQDSNLDGYEDTRFARTTEDIFQYLTNEADTTCQRIYYAKPNVTPRYWSRVSSYVFESDQPGGKAVPADLRKPTVPWNAGPADIASAINGGAFLAVYRGHGSRIVHVPADWSWLESPSGWSAPAFLEDDAQALHNGLLVSVVWSVTCRTGWFDNETDLGQDYLYDGSSVGTAWTDPEEESLCEEFLLNPAGGAVGLIGATRNSFSGYNDRLAWGWMDAIWPGFIEYHDAGYGGSTPVREMGPVFEYGRGYLQTKYADGSARRTTLDEFHWFGDPSMEIWTGVPQPLTVEAVPGDLPRGQPADLRVSVMKGDQPVAGARVAISRPGNPGDCWTGRTDDTGGITLTGVQAPANGDCNLVVTAHNCIPHVGAIGSGLADAVDATGLFFTTGGDAPWFRQTATYHLDGDAAQSGDISHHQQSWIQTTVAGPGTLKFWWKVSSESDGDYLEFCIDEIVQQGTVAGSVGWRQETYALVPGLHTLKWRYRKDGSGRAGSDCAWVDKIEWSGPPVVWWFAVNDGEESTTARDVTLNSLCSCGPMQYMASESSSFSGASWQPYVTARSFTLSSGGGAKTVYFKVRNASGESPVATDTIVMAADSPVGTWNLAFRWNGGNQGSTTVLFKADGTFTTSGGYNGTWTQTGNSVVWTYTSGTCYRGTFDSSSTMSGTMTSSSGNPGTWTAVRQ